MKGGLGFLFIRRALFNGIYNTRVKESFTETYLKLQNRRNKNSYDNNMIDFMLAVMDMAQKELENKNLQLAARDINFLHNLPETIHNDWDEDHFYKGELLGYIDDMSKEERVDKIKIIVKLIAQYLLK